MKGNNKFKRQSQLIDAIKANESEVLKMLYISNYKKIESLVLKNSGTIEDAKDIYQEAFIVFWKNIKSNTFIPLNETAIQGYLYTIAKNKWMDIVKSSRFRKTLSGFNNQFQLTKIDYDDSFSENSENKKLTTAMEAFRVLGQPCKKLLTTFYFEKKSLKDLSLQLQINEASVRNKKYRCMKKLRNIIKALNN
ncbi:RNA polymerase sigma factor [Mariniflexile sp.]|uniref:RNA polymerase sigma factor n=1 Tax=Mariniflexile sp. TaxID=1979402 RepID=UPI003565FDCB